ncbi:MAG: glucosamine-6-phosphate deaminase [Verrucomicrobiota bacterium]
MSNVIVHPDAAAAAAAVAATVAQLIRDARRQGRKAVLGLATGSTPLPLYRELVRLHREQGLSFADVITFNLDEYEGLAGSHPQSYRRYMDEHLFSQVDIPASATHVPDGTAADPAQACRDFEEAIRRAGGVDLQILGIGRTGHIGFNEPPSPRESRTRRVVLDEVTRRDNSAFFGNVESVPRAALTMGVATILDARRIELLAFGRGKAEIVRRARQEKPGPDCPATWLQEHGACTFHLDPESASGSGV